MARAAVGTAVVVGTAGAVSHHQQQKYGAQDQARLLVQTARLMNRRKHECAVRDGDPMARIALRLHGLGVQLGGRQVIKLVVAPG